MADTFKYRIDHHGSLVRPAELLNARNEHARGALDDEGLRRAEDKAVADAVRDQRRLNLSVVTDGEFRREESAEVVLAGVSGFQRLSTEGESPARWAAVAELKADVPLVADDVAAVDGQTQIAAKATLPAPSALALRTFQEGRGPWRSARELGEAIAALLREEIRTVIERGVRYVQLTATHYGTHLSGGGGGLSLADAVAVDSLAVDLGTKPEGVRIGLCPAHTAPGSVNAAVAERLFGELPVDRWILPYCKGTEAEAALLRAVPVDRDVCLGVVDPADPELEDVDTVMDRMDAAAEIKDIEDLAVSPSAGFSDVAGGALLDEEGQRRKLVHVETFARMCWGNEL